MLGSRWNRRVSILLVPLGGQFHQPVNNGLAVPLQHLGQAGPGKPLVHRRVPRQQPVVQRRQRELHIVRVEALRLAALPRQRRQPYPAVPKLLADPPDRLLHLLLCDLPVQQVHQVHIRVREQLAPAISSQRHQRNPRPQQLASVPPPASTDPRSTRPSPARAPQSSPRPSRPPQRHHESPASGAGIRCAFCLRESLFPA